MARADHDGRVEASELLPSEAARFEEVCRFGQDRLEPLGLTVAAAFADDPVWKWIYGSPGDAIAPDQALVLARWLVAEVSPVDEIHGFRHHDAVALWHAPSLPSNQDVTAAHRDATTSFREALREVLGDRLALVRELGKAIAQVRPEEPHWYLATVATHPDRHGQGLGGRLLAPMHERCDRLGLPCFLESSNPRNYSLYRRHGYVETAEFTAGDSPPLMGFFRAPR